MAGHLSGDPSQDAFTHWLHSNYVSREDLDRRLGTMAADLTENVMKMIKSSEEAQIAAAVAAATAAQQEQDSVQQHVVVAGNGSGIGSQVYTVKFLNFQTQENLAVINLKFKQRCQTFGFFTKNMQMEKQTVKTLIGLL